MRGRLLSGVCQKWAGAGWQFAVNMAESQQLEALLPRGADLGMHDAKEAPAAASKGCAADRLTMSGRMARVVACTCCC
jgi:hypothetical protein